MLIIRDEQIKAMRRPLLRAFEDEMVARMRTRHPVETANQTDRTLRILTRDGIDEAFARGVVIACEVSRIIEERLLEAMEWSVYGRRLVPPRPGGRRSRTFLPPEVRKRLRKFPRST